MDAKTFQTLAVGDIITYTLAADQRPANPQRTYRGVVTSIVHKAESVIVMLLDEGYEGLSEPEAGARFRALPGHSAKTSSEMGRSPDRVSLYEVTWASRARYLSLRTARILSLKA
jgi:hypothetical protein